MALYYSHKIPTTNRGRTFTTCTCNEACNISDTNTHDTILLPVKSP